MNRELPIVDFRNQILKAIKESQVTIIMAETGAGKSTQVPQYLLQDGYEVLVTQPRRLAARTVAERVAFEWGSQLGGMVGFRTAFERAECQTTRCLFVTDGLALVSELLGKRKPKTVLVIDEVHEWNLNIEVLVAYIQKRLGEDQDLKVVLMSATMEAQELSKYFGGAPIIDVPGRQFPVENIKDVDGEMIDYVKMLLEAGVNTLVFMPGKGEVDDFCEELKGLSINAEILPLYAELTPEAQAKCFAHYDRPKCIVSTNVAQTSITIDDIRAVVDSGMEKRKMVRDGIEGLYLMPISEADSKQRRGRAGRCAGGIYVDFFIDYQKRTAKYVEGRLKFPEAEIMRLLLDHVVLRLAVVGLDAEKLPFFHQPSVKAIHQAKESLRLIGCLDADGNVTEIGRQVERFPVSVKCGRMLVEAQKLGVISDMITIVAIMEAGGIVDRKGMWRQLCAGENQSDLLAMLSIYKQCEGQKVQWMIDNGVHRKSLFRSREIRRHITECFRKEELTSSGNRGDIIKAICAGFVDHVFRKGHRGYQNGTGPERRLSNNSVVGDWNSWIVGAPFNINNKGQMTIMLVQMVTVVSPDILKQVAPHLIKIESGLDPHFDHRERCVVSTTRVYFAGKLVSMRTEADPNHPQARQILNRPGNGEISVLRPVMPASRESIIQSPDGTIILKTFEAL